MTTWSISYRFKNYCIFRIHYYFYRIRTCIVHDTFFYQKKPPVKKPTLVELTSLKFPGKTSNLHIIVLMNVLLRAVGQFYRNAQCFQQNLRYA